MYIHTCIHACMHACIHTYIHTYVVTLCTYIYMDIYVYIISMYMYMHVWRIGICICKCRYLFLGCAFKDGVVVLRGPWQSKSLTTSNSWMAPWASASMILQRSLMHQVPPAQVTSRPWETNVSKRKNINRPWISTRKRLKLAMHVLCFSFLPLV